MEDLKEEKKLSLKTLDGEISKIKDGQKEFLDLVKAELQVIKDEIANFKTFHSNPILDTPKRVLPELKPESTATVVTTGKLPVPPEYQDIVKYALNAKFQATIDYNPEGMSFTIVVPDKYSTLTVEQRKNIGGDLRTKVVPNFEGANGIKLWAEKVFNSFSTEIRSQIMADRNNN